MSGEKETVLRRRPGRPAKHLDAADRQAAYRERQATAGAVGHAAQALMQRPNARFIKLMIDRALAQADDQEALRAELQGHLAVCSPTE